MSLDPPLQPAVPEEWARAHGWTGQQPPERALEWALDRFTPAPDLLRQALALGFDPNHPNAMYGNESLLSHACRRKHPEAVRLLLDAGAAATGEEAFFATLAASTYSQDCLQVLIERGVDTDEALRGTLTPWSAPARSSAGRRRKCCSTPARVSRDIPLRACGGTPRWGPQRALQPPRAWSCC